MNKLLFNEGGQPVFLDDLKTLQESPQEQFSMLLAVLGSNEEIFLMNAMTGKLISVDETTGKSTFKTERNRIAKEGVIYEIPETTIVVDSFYDPLYVGFKTTESDRRNFNDGQEHACLAVREAFLSTTKLDDSMQNVWSLKTMWSLMAPLVKANTASESYKNIRVEFRNGYSGIVQYKDVGDAYRIRIDIKSENAEWDTGGIPSADPLTSLLSFTDQDFPYSDRTFYADIVIGVGGDTSARAGHASLVNRENTLWLEGVSGMDFNTPSNCPVKTIFEIPK